MLFRSPWLCAEVKAKLEGAEVPSLPPLAQRMETATRQFELAMEDKGEHIACLEARKHFAWYLKGVAHSNFYKEQISHISAATEVYAIVKGICRDLQ